MLAEKQLNSKSGEGKSEANLGILSHEVVFQDKNELKDIPMKAPAVIK